MNFDLDDFRARAIAIAEKLNWSHATLSKRLFSTARTLPSMTDSETPDDKKTFPRLDTLIEAEKRLAAIERDLQGAS